MSVATQPTDFSDLITDLQNRSREQTGVTATADIAKRWINIALMDMHVGTSEGLPWAERRAILRTQAKYTTGTVTITTGSTTLTGTDTLWNTNNDFSVANARTTGRVVIDGTPEIYDVSAVGSDTSITLATAYVGEDVTAGGYTYFEDRYALSADFLRPVDLQIFDANREIRLIGRQDFRRKYPRNKDTGAPRFATIVDEAFSGSTTRVRRVYFHPVPDKAYQIPYGFITNKLAVTAAGVEATQLVNDDDEPIVPLQYRHAIVFHALYHWYRDRKDDDRAKAAENEYTGLMVRMLNDVEVGATRPSLQPVMSTYRRNARTPYRSGRSRRYTLGNAFDQMRD